MFPDFKILIILNMHHPFKISALCVKFGGETSNKLALNNVFIGTNGTINTFSNCIALVLFGFLIF
jgi:hypothetical protein